MEEASTQIFNNGYKEGIEYGKEHGRNQGLEQGQKLKLQQIIGQLQAKGFYNSEIAELLNIDALDF